MTTAKKRSLILTTLLVIGLFSSMALAQDATFPTQPQVEVRLGPTAATAQSGWFDLSTLPQDVHFWTLTWYGNTTFGTIPTCTIKVEKATIQATPTDLIPDQDCTVNGSTAVSYDNSSNYVRISLGTKSGAGRTSAILSGFRQDPYGAVSVTGTVTVTGPIEVEGDLTNNSTAPVGTNIGAMTAVATAASPTYAEGRLVFDSNDLHGNKRTVICDGDGNDRCADVGTDESLAVSTALITYNSTQPTLVNSDQSDLQITSRGELKVSPGVSNFPVQATVASGGVASGAIASGAVASGAFASGALASGSIASGAAAAGAFSAQSFSVGAVPPAAGTLASGFISTAMTGTTSTVFGGGLAATASNYIYITHCVTSNGSTTVSTDILLQDGNGGTTLYVLPAPAAAVASTGGGGGSFALPVPLKVPTAGNALYAANVTTGASTKISCSGFKSAVSY